MQGAAVEKYRSILDLPHPEPKGRLRMSREKRAAQFMPFAALSGFAEGIAEEANEQEERMNDDDRVEWEKLLANS